MINPAEIPQIPGDMAALSGHAATLSGVGTAFAATGARVHTTWQGLAAVYQAPEAAELLAATGPVQSVSASVGDDITAVGAALSIYATDVTAIKARLDALRAQATIFIDTIHTTAPDVDWRDDEGDVEHNNQLISDVNAAVADFMDAQRRCANTILALYSDQRYTAENADGTITQYEFGYTADVLDGAMAVDGALAWGTAEEHNRGFFGDLGAFGLGVKDGAVGMAVGLGMLGGYADGEWSWGTAGTAWAGLGTFALALAVYGTGGAGLDQAGWIPGFEKGELGGTLLNAGKAIIAYDTWGEDKSRAAGMATFNILSTIIGTKGAGAGIRAGGTALEASRFAAIARAGTGAVRAGEFLGHLPTIQKVVDAFDGRVSWVHDRLTSHGSAPTGHLDTPETPDAAGGTTPGAAPHGATEPHAGTGDRDAVDTPNGRTPDGETTHTPDGPSVGDAVAHTPDSTRPDAPQPRSDAEHPLVVDAGRETVHGSGVNGGPGSALDGPRAAGADSPLDTPHHAEAPNARVEPTPDALSHSDASDSDGPRPDATPPPDSTPNGEIADQPAHATTTGTLDSPHPNGDATPGQSSDATADDPSSPAPSPDPSTMLPPAERLVKVYRRLGDLPAATTAQEALDNLNRTLDDVEDQHSGVAKDPHPGLAFDGRMYPPREDFIERAPDGSLTATTKGNIIHASPDGELRILSRRTGVEVFRRGGAG